MRGKDFRIDIVTPGSTVFSGEANSFFAPSVDGYFEILKNHAPFISILKTGKIVITQNGVKKYFAISSGFAEVLNNRITVLAETAESSEKIDVERSQASKERALKRLGDKSPSIDIERAVASLLRAVTRLSIAEMK